MEFPCITYLFSYTDRKNRQTDRRKDRQTGGQTDRQVNKLKHFFVGGWGDCGYGVDGRKMHLGNQKGR